MNCIIHLALLSLSFLVPAVSFAGAPPSGDWTQWRGPTATGEAAPDAKPPTSWSENDNIAWKTAIPGGGRASPIVWNDRIFILTAVPTAKTVAPEKVKAALDEIPDFARKGAHAPDKALQFVVIALKRSDGTVLWQKTVSENEPFSGTHADASWASGSPTTDGEMLYAYFGSYGLYALSPDGELKWSKDLGRFKTKANFGEGISPVISGKLLIVNQDFEGDSFIAAFDKKSGEEIWRVKRDEKTSWSTPLLLTQKGNEQLVVPATNRIRSYNPADGALIWEMGGMTQNVIPCPVTDGNLVFCMSGFRGNAILAIRLDEASGDMTGKPAALAWESKKDAPYVPSPVLSGGLLYYIKTNTGFLTCAKAGTGEALYAEKLQDMKTVFASPVAAGGNLYVASKEGMTAVIKLGPEFKAVSYNKLDEGIIASPAVAGNDLYIRGSKSLYCIREK